MLKYSKIALVAMALESFNFVEYVKGKKFIKKNF